MVILIVLVILWTPYVVTRLMLRAQHSRTPAPAHPPQAYAGPPSGADTPSGCPYGPLWSALDDRS